MSRPTNVLIEGSFVGDVGLTALLVGHRKRHSGVAPGTLKLE
jgi:hypothetical protein